MVEKIILEKFENLERSNAEIKNAFTIFSDQTDNNFNALTTRVDKLDEKVDILTTRVDKLDEKVDILTTRVDKLDEKVDILTTRVDKLDEKVDVLGEQLEIVATTVAEHSVRLDKLTEIALEHSERLNNIEIKLENTATKDDIGKIMDVLDVIVGNTKKNDQEQTMMGSRVGRIDKKAEEHDIDIKKMKPLLGFT